MAETRAFTVMCENLESLTSMDRLQARGIASLESICRELRASLSALPSEGGSETPEAVFARLGGSAGRA